MSATPKRGKPPVEKKTASGPIITPQVLGIAFGIILLVGVIAYYQMVVNKFTAELAQVESNINATNQQIATYQKKGGMKETADELNKTIRAKLHDMNYMFLGDQNDMLPFWNQTMFPLIFSNTLALTADSVIILDEFVYHINMAMDPMDTLPGWPQIDGQLDFFPIVYEGERDGVPVESPLDTRPDNFLYPYNIELQNFRGTYEDAKKFIEKFQLLRRDRLFTVHCLLNDPDSTTGLWRSETDWSLKLTVYFMNPDAPATGPEPPDPPGAHTC